MTRPRESARLRLAAQRLRRLALRSPARTASRRAVAGRAASSTLVRYWIFQLPGFLVVAGLLWALVHWWGLAPRLAALFLGLWVLKDLALYPLVRRAYEPRSGGGADALVGALATARDRLDPDGYVRVGHELWRARLRTGAAEKGAPVRVVEVRGLTLVVEIAERGEDA